MDIYQTISLLGFVSGNHTVIASDPYNYTSYNPLPDMSSNICSNVYNNDRELISMLNMETWNMFGVKIIYYQATYNTSYDKIWGEDGDRYIISAYDKVMAYFQLPRENRIWSKFGIEGVNDFSMFISKDHYNYVTDGYIPKVGDIILALNDNKFYEVTEVKEEAPSFMLSKQYAWELICRKMKVENELSVAPNLSASPIASIYGVKDIFNIKTDIDVEKEEIIYEPIKGEKPQEDPFGVW